jgi:hypothetical protein
MNILLSQPGSTVQDSISAGDFLAALKRADAPNDVIVIKGKTYQLSSAEIRPGLPFQLTAAKSITATLVNAGAAAASIDIDFADAIPVDAVPVGMFYKLVTPFASVTRDIDAGTPKDNTTAFTNTGLVAADWVTASRQGFLGTKNIAVLKGAARQLRVSLTFNGGGNNPKDYSAGQLNCYVAYSNWPTLG